MEARIRDELLTLSEFAWKRLQDRLDGLSDAEYLWMPVPDGWTIRPSDGGAWVMDGTWPPPEPPPVTTIAWRVSHLVTDDRFPTWLGLVRAQSRPPRTVPSNATDAIEAVSRARAEMSADLRERTDADLWEPIGPVGGAFAEATRVAWVLHALDEVIHHGAEIGLLRDLYRSH